MNLSVVGDQLNHKIQGLLFVTFKKKNKLPKHDSHNLAASFKLTTEKNRHGDD